ncbi:MAG TPA: hypothetical protein VFS43_27050 [Polyangiaceae bacterium]|nr:hypothetical protein [Polyangiaceae bacterium]
MGPPTAPRQASTGGADVGDVTHNPPPGGAAHGTPPGGAARGAATGDATARLAALAARRAAAAHPGRPLDALLADDLGGNDLKTLVMHALRRRARRRSFADLRAELGRLAMAHASEADARRLHAFDGAFFAAAAGFEAIELAPVQPLGASACAGVDPNHVLATHRAVEASSDPATALALHAARRRLAGDRGPVRLCASLRVLRLQPLDDPAFRPHFRLAALASAARSTGPRDDDGCERRALLEHLLVWADAFDRAAAAGFRTSGLRVLLSDTRLVRACLLACGIDPEGASRLASATRPDAADGLLHPAGGRIARAAPDPVEAARALGLGARELALAAALARDVAEPLRARRPDVEVAFDLGRLQGLSYYAGPFVRLVLRRDDGLELGAGDGGATTWLQALHSDRRERLVTTGVGAELLVKLFDGPRAP